MSSTLYCFATRAHLCIFLLPSTTGIPLSSFWQVQVPCTKSQFQHFRVVHWAVQIRFHSYIFSQPSSKSLKCFSSFTLFLSASFCLNYVLLLLLSCTPKLLYGQYLFLVSSCILPTFSTTLSHLFPARHGQYLFLVSSYILPPFSTTLSHLFPARPVVTLSHTALSTMTGTLFFGMFLTLYIARSAFSRFYPFQVGTFPVLLLILYYLSFLSILVLF